MKIKEFLTKNWTLILYFALSIFAVLPFFSSGFFSIHDDVQVARVYEMANSLSGGVFPVRWVSNLGYGLGYPIFNFYSVLPYYIGGFIALLGFDVLIATKAVFIASTVLAGASMYFLASAFFGKIPALVAAVVYLYFPYHAANIFVRGDLAELTAYVFLPLVFLSLFKIHEGINIKTYVILGSISVAAVIISHNLTSFMMFIFMGIFMLVSLISTKKKKETFIRYSLILTIAFLLSSFYAIPAALESRYTNVMSQVGGGSNYPDHFICLTQLWDSPWGFGGSAPGCLDGMSFKLGKTNIIFGIFALLSIPLMFRKLKSHKLIVMTALGFLIFSIFMTLEYSISLWRLPLMAFLQFPWRFLNYVGLFGAFLIGFLVWSVEQKKKESIGMVLAVIIIASTIFINGKLFSPQQMLSRSASYYTNPDYLRWTASKISDEYLPKNFGSPGTREAAREYMARYKASEGSLYRKMSDGRGGYKFSSKETTIQQVSNLLSIIGVVVLLVVIIGKRDSLYGKKTS